MYTLDEVADEYMQASTNILDKPPVPLPWYHPRLLAMEKDGNPVKLG